MITGTCDVSYMYRYADPIAGRHEAHLRKATRSGVKSARAKEQVNGIAEATQQSTKSGRLHLSYNQNNLKKKGTKMAFLLCYAVALFLQITICDNSFYFNNV